LRPCYNSAEDISDLRSYERTTQEATGEGSTWHVLVLDACGQSIVATRTRGTGLLPIPIPYSKLPRDQTRTRVYTHTRHVISKPSHFVGIRAVSGAPLSSSGLEEALQKWAE